MRPEDVVPEELDPRDIGLYQIGTEYHRVLNVRPSDWTTNDVRPATVLAALQQQAPGGDYQMSLEDTNLLDTAIAYAIECLTPEDIFILNAVHSEGLGHTELGRRLGVSRSQGWRLHKRSLNRLRTLLLNHQPVRERLGMPESWNAAAMTELVAIAGYDEGPEGCDGPLPSYVNSIAWRIGEAAHRLNVMHRENDAVDALCQAADFAVCYLRSIGKWSLLDMHTLLCSKQNDYGHGNILKFGMVGVVVRASDKAERLKNLTLREGVKPANESVMDTFFDIVGYAVIARMLKAETFELELEREEDGTERFSAESGEVA